MNIFKAVLGEKNMIRCAGLPALPDVQDYQSNFPTAVHFRDNCHLKEGFEAAFQWSHQ